LFRVTILKVTLYKTQERLHNGIITQRNIYGIIFAPGESLGDKIFELKSDKNIQQR